MAYVNHLILQESYMLGKNMGLSQDLLVDVIRWSCGTSWVFENESFYQPAQNIMTKIKNYHFEKQAQVPTITKIIDLLG